MKKIILLCLLILGLMLIGCSTEPELSGEEMDKLVIEDLELDDSDSETIDGEESIYTWTGCNDAGGNNPSAFGSVTATYQYGKEPITRTLTWEDKCLTSEEGYLREIYCDGKELKSQIYECESGCENGACVEEVEEEEPECFHNDDCPEEILGEPYCNDQDQVCNNSISYICENPGTPESSCLPEPQICTNCEYGCEKGVCKEKPFTCELSNTLVMDESGTYSFMNSTYDITFDDALYQAYAGGIRQADFQVDGKDFSILEGEHKEISGDVLLHLTALIEKSEGLEAIFCFASSE